MSVDFVDASGRSRPSEDLEAALVWVKKKIIRADLKDPEGVIHCVAIKDALEELLAIRGVIEKAKRESDEKMKE